MEDKDLIDNFDYLSARINNIEKILIALAEKSGIDANYTVD